MPQLPLIAEEELKKASNVFRAINNPLRKQILKLLQEKQQARVTEIYVDLGIVQSVASQHLKILREANLVETQRKGKVILYKLNYDNLKKIEKIVSELLKD